VRAARGEWLCFMDADTFAAPELLASTLAAAQTYRAHMLSLVPQQELGTFWEKVVLPIVFTGMAVGWPAERVNDPTKPDAIAIGQFVLIRRAAYDAVGGHAALGHLIVEDQALAHAVKSAGYRLVLGDGAGLVRTRMYHSLEEIWEGFTKNIYLGLRGRLPLLLFGVLVSLLGTFTLPVWAGLALWWLAHGGGAGAVTALLEAAALWAVVLFVRARAAAGFGIPPWYSFTLPLGTFVFAGLMLGSLFKIATGRGVTWKGRRYADG
jgi:chlorobactene glucosyltransferase